MTNIITHVQLSLGYVEEATLPVILLENAGGFTNAWDAMRSLAQMLMDWARSEKPEKCGKKKCPGDFQSTYCPECGVLKSYRDEIDILEYVHRMWSETNNDLYEFWEHLERHEWGVTSVRGISPAHTLLFVEGFDRLMGVLTESEEVDYDGASLGYLFDCNYEFQKGEFYPLGAREEEDDD